MEDQPLLSLLDVSRSYNGASALNNISFTANSGELIGLLGPNGAGKSTLMKCIAGSLRPTQGKILLGELDYASSLKEIKAKIGYLAENNPLYNEMYVSEYLYWVAELRNVGKEKIEIVLNQLNLADRAKQKIKTLSKGYKQRVGIAQAILHEPAILILDEATNGLDPQQILEVRNLIKAISKNTLILFSSHILQEIEALCDRVILLNKGEMILDLPVDEFRKNGESVEKAFLTNLKANPTH